MKLYVYRPSDNKEVTLCNFLIVSGVDILDADSKVKAAGFNPMKLLCGNLLMALETNTTESRKFVFNAKDTDGKLLYDEKGDAIIVTEFRDCPLTLTEGIRFEDQDDIREFLGIVDSVYKSYDAVCLVIGETKVYKSRDELIAMLKPHSNG